MPRSAYIAAVVTKPSQAARDGLDEIAAGLARGSGWAPVKGAGPWRIWSWADRPPPISVFPETGATLIGDAFQSISSVAAGAAVEPGPGGMTLLAAARRISASHWGRFVALLAGSDGPGLYRDPSGHVDALLWEYAPGVQVVASEIERVPVSLGPRRLGLHWGRIAEFLARPAAVTTAPLFDGMEAVGPGDLRVFDGRRDSLPVWRPSAFVEPAIEGGAAAAELVRRVDLCTAALVGGHDRVLFELSGGLDSSILAGALGRMQLTSRVAQWLTWVAERPEADETLYAAAVAERLGVQLTCIPKVAEALNAADLAELGSSLWPAMSGADAARDREEVGRLVATGASAIVSGQGGDAVFFQMRSALVLADAIRHDGLAVLTSPLLANVARRTQQSVWSVIKQMRHAGLEAEEAALLSPDLRRAAQTLRHAWVREAEAGETPPAKRQQIQAIANCHVYHGQSRRRAHADLLYPLLAQPVLELCLAIPAHHLAGGAHDRMYARTVFRNRIPEVVRRRRSKGALNAYFGRLVALSADVLRPYLLDGCLAEAGLLDRTNVASALDPDELIREGRPTGVLWAASVEAWVRYWQSRLPDSAAAPRPRP